MKVIKERFHCTTFFNLSLGNKKKDREESLDKNGISVKKTKGSKSVGVANKGEAKKPHQDIDIRHNTTTPSPQKWREIHCFY